MTELIQLLENDEGLIDYIKRLVKRRLTNESFLRDKEWTERVVDLSIDEVLDKLDIRSIIDAYRSRSLRKSQLHENRSRPPFSETEPTLTIRSRSKRRSSDPHSSSAPAGLGSPSFESEKSDEDSVRQSSDCNISEASTVQGLHDTYDNSRHQVRQISPPRFQKTRSKLHDSSLSRQSNLAAILERARNDESNDSILIYEGNQASDPGNSGDKLSSEFGKGLSASTEDRVLVDSTSSFGGEGHEVRESLNSVENPSMPPEPEYSLKIETVQSDDSRMASSLGSLSSDTSFGIGVPPRKASTSPHQPPPHSLITEADAEDTSSGVSSTHSDLSDTTPDYFTKNQPNSATSPILSITTDRDPTYTAPSLPSPAYEDDFESSPNRVVRFAPGIVSEVFLTRYKYTEEETLELFYSNDDTILFSSEYEQEYRMADVHNSSWYDWMMGQAGEEEGTTVASPPKILKFGGEFLENDGNDSEATETASYSWDHEDGIHF